ncbi:MAG: heavy metal translocating P-type ATPase [Eubacteriales bacterium]
MKTETYDIGGMHCAACSSAIERVTRKLPGVERSEVNLPMNRLSITYDEAQVDSAKVIGKIEKAGFTASLQGEKSKEQPKIEEKSFKKEKISLFVSIGFSAVLLYVSMGQMLFANLPMPDLFSMNTHPVNFAILQMLLTIPVLVLGKRFFTSGFTSLVHGNPNMDTLVAMSAVTSFGYSLVMTFLISDTPHYAHHLYYESAAIVVALVSVGKYLEAKNKEKTKGAIESLMKLTPEVAILVNSDGQWEVPTDVVKVGDTVLVKAGQSVPLDGTVVEGTGSINEAMLTGESLPVEKTVDSSVIGGSICVDGALFVKITKIAGDTTVSKIIKFVEDAQGQKAPIAKTADKVAGVFVPVVLAIATVASVIWMVAGYELAFAIQIFTAVLVIACPCSMGLATPTSIIVGTGLGASKGILIRSGQALETTHSVGVAIFDKTGTLTKGEMTVSDVAPLGISREKLLAYAVAVEKLSNHPLAKAVCSVADELGILPNIEAFENANGMGIVAKTTQGEAVVVGNVKLMNRQNIDVIAHKSAVEVLESLGKTVVYVAVDGALVGYVAIADQLQDTAPEAVKQLKAMGIKTVLLTGDNQLAADHMGALAGVDEIIAQVLPTEKADVVKKYQDMGKIVLMVGDGINDAPALAQADIGCAVAAGSDIAMESAQIVLMKNDLLDIPRAIHLSRHTMRNIRQNLFWAFCYNSLCIPIAAGALYLPLGLLLSPMIGGLAMSLSSLFVVGNALRLKGAKL